MLHIPLLSEEMKEIPTAIETMSEKVFELKKGQGYVFLEGSLTGSIWYRALRVTSKIEGI